MRSLNSVDVLTLLKRFIFLKEGGHALIVGEKNLLAPSFINFLLRIKDMQKSKVKLNKRDAVVFLLFALIFLGVVLYLGLVGFGFLFFFDFIVAMITMMIVYVYVIYKIRNR